MNSSHAKIVNQLSVDLEQFDTEFTKCEEAKGFDQVNKKFLLEHPSVHQNFSAVMHGSIAIAATFLEDPKNGKQPLSNLAKHIKFFMDHSKDLADDKTKVLCNKILEELLTVVPDLKL